MVKQSRDTHKNGDPVSNVNVWFCGGVPTCTVTVMYSYERSSSDFSSVALGVWIVPLNLPGERSARSVSPGSAMTDTADPMHITAETVKCILNMEVDTRRCVSTLWNWDPRDTFMAKTVPQYPRNCKARTEGPTYN